MVEGSGEETVGRFRNARSIEVDVDACNVTIHAGDDDGVVEVRLADRRDRTRPDLLDVEREGDVLQVRVRARGEKRWRRNRGPDVRLAIGAPPSMPVSVRAAAGAVRVIDRSGPVHVAADAGAVKLVDCTGDASVRTDAGAIKVEGHASDTLTLETSAGSVKATGARVATVRAATDVGSINLEFSEPPSDVSATCSVGSVAVVLPPDRYRIEPAVSGLGRASVEGLQHDPTSSRVVRVAAHGLGSAKVVAAHMAMA